jgi:HD-like signal output (HDOD) protein
LHPALLHVTGIHHADIGSMLLEKWRFPAVLVQALRGQYADYQRGSEVALCVQVANQLSKRIGADFASRAPAQALSSAMEQALGGTLDEVLESLGDIGVVLEEGSKFADL